MATPAPVFYLGVPQPAWIARTATPLMLSHRRLRRRRACLPRGRGPVVIDSGAFSELSSYGRFLTSECEYVDSVDRYRAEIGTVAWAAPQDWMCEAQVIARTGLSVAQHQQRTVENFCRLDAARSGVFIPVLQGWSQGEYESCVDLYARCGVDLWARPLVGVGSICRRGGTRVVGVLLRHLARSGLRLHAFGLKAAGLIQNAASVYSADSAAWSLCARRRPALWGRNGRNELGCALAWRALLLGQLSDQEAVDVLRPLEADRCVRPTAWCMDPPGDAMAARPSRTAAGELATRPR